MSLSSLFQRILTGGMILLILGSISKIPRPPQPLLLSELFKGSERGYHQPGYEVTPLIKYLPAKGVISFIQDTPYDKTKLSPERLLMLQNLLAPRLLSPEPGAPAALIECSSHAKAVERASQTGYQFLYDDLTGRGVLTKAS